MVGKIHYISSPVINNGMTNTGRAIQVTKLDLTRAAVSCSPIPYYLAGAGFGSWTSGKPGRACVSAWVFHGGCMVMVVWWWGGGL